MGQPPPLGVRCSGPSLGPYTPESNFTYETPERLFGLADYTFPSWGRKYDISPDGQRFLFLKAGLGLGGEESVAPSLIVVQNWFEELRRLVPTN